MVWVAAVARRRAVDGREKGLARLAAALFGRNGAPRDGAPFEIRALSRTYVGPSARSDRIESLTAIVILALVALFVGLRLYAVLGERTGHEQPILKPADPDARVEQPRANATARAAHRSPTMAIWPIVPTAGPGRARDPGRRSGVRRRPLPRRRQGRLSDDPRSLLEGRSRRHSTAMSTAMSTTPSPARSSSARRTA